MARRRELALLGAVDAQITAELCRTAAEVESSYAGSFGWATASSWREVHQQAWARVRELQQAVRGAYRPDIAADSAPASEEKIQDHMAAEYKRRFVDGTAKADMEAAALKAREPEGMSDATRAAIASKLDVRARKFRGRW